MQVGTYLPKTVNVFIPCQSTEGRYGVEQCRGEPFAGEIISTRGSQQRALGVIQEEVIKFPIPLVENGCDCGAKLGE